MTRTTMAAAAAALAAACLANQADGHTLQTCPFSRQYANSPVFNVLPNGDEITDREFCPACYNSGGIGGADHVRDRSIRLINSDVLARYGGGMVYPLPHGEIADNGNYLESDEIAVRHGICGDPSSDNAEDFNKFGTASSNWPIFHEFNAGESFKIDIFITAYHWGHYEFFICNTDELPEGADSVPTQECFNRYPLDRDPAHGAFSPIDPNYPGRYHMDPECTASETNYPNDSQYDDDAGWTARMYYLIPDDLTCDHCVLQAVYRTGHRCRHPGYDEFEGPEPFSTSLCAPNREDWINTGSSGVCGEPDTAYAEEFWHCTDLRIVGGGGGPGPTPEETPAPESETSSPASPEPEPETPTPEETPAPEPDTSSPVSPEPEPETSSPVSPEETPGPQPTEMPTATDMPDTEEPTSLCSDGTPGIESPNGACCVFECGQCGGSSCAALGESLNLGPGDCCEETILELNYPCGEFYDAPCVVQNIAADECEGGPVAAYEQCGGGPFMGSTCCEDGYECTAVASCYSQCRPIEGVLEIGIEPVTPDASTTPAPVETDEPVSSDAPPTGDDGCMVVIIEAEDLEIFGSWSVMQDSAASGGEYITWEGLSEGANNRDPEEGDIITTTIDITTPGSYRFQWLMRQPSGVVRDKGNDAWVNFPNADRYGPADSDASYGGFVKVFGRATNGVFRYDGRADVENLGNEIAVEFGEAGQYAMEISGRSHGFQLDQIILFGDTFDVDEAAAGCR